MYYIYKKPDGLPCVTECEQNGMELIGTAESVENAEILKLYLTLKFQNDGICDGNE